MTWFLDIAVGTAVIVLKSLVQYLPDPLSTIRTLAQRLFPALQPSRYPQTSASTPANTGIKHPQGRACILWLVGQYAPREEWTPDVLRLAIKYFFKEGSEPGEKEKDEDARVKLQVVTLGAKVWVEWCHPSSASSSEDAKSTRLDKLVGYLFTLARYDRSFDVRDRARMLAGLLGLGTQGQELSERGGVVLRKEQVRVVLFEGRGPAPTGVAKDVDRTDRESSVGSASGLLGSTSLVLGRPDLFTKERESESDEWFGGLVLPEWLARGVDGSLRNSEWEKAPLSGSSGIGIRTGSEKSGFGFGSGSGFGVRTGGFQGGSGSGSQSQSPVVLTPVSSSLTTAMDVVKSKYEDLDAFYAEEEQEEDVDNDEEEEEETEEEEDENDEEEEGESGEGESGSESGEEQDDDEGEREHGQAVPSPRG